MAIFTGIALTFAVGLAAVLILCIKPEPPNANLTSGDYLNIAQIVAYSLALVTGASAAAIAYRAHRIKEVDATNKRFNEAVRSLNTKDKSGEANYSIRLEGIYALQRLAENAPHDRERRRVMNVLCQYLRYNRGVDYYKENPNTPLELDYDEETIIAVLVELSKKYKRRIRIDLSYTNLYGADFNGAHLARASFYCSHCEHINFEFAHFNDTIFKGAYTRDARFTDTTGTSGLDKTKIRL